MAFEGPWCPAGVSLPVHVYLIHTKASHSDALAAAARDLFDDPCELWQGTIMVESDESQSRVYHAFKHVLPKDTPLFAARLDHQPKFKGNDRGALKWIRERFDTMTA